MKIELFVSPTFEPCRKAEQIWRGIASQQQMDLTVVDITDKNGEKRAQALGIKMVPALVIDGRLLAVGVQTIEEGKELIARQRG